MYRKMVNEERGSMAKCTPLVLEPEVKVKPHEATQRLTGHNRTKDRIDGESDETSRKTRQQISKLTEIQRAILIKTFAKLENNPVKNALKILLKLFAEHPHYKQVWPQFRAIPDSSLMNAIELRRHASVYMCGLGAIIHSMNREKDLAIQMNRIAKAHIKWKVHRAHVVHMLEPVLEVVKECNKDFNEETKEAWTTLYYIIAELIEIYRHKK